MTLNIDDDQREFLGIDLDNLKDPKPPVGIAAFNGIFFMRVDALKKIVSIDTYHMRKNGWKLYAGEGIKTEISLSLIKEITDK